ncbi:MAG: hypothetical protein ACKOEW_05490, partial [Methylocystis sp.]
MSAWIAGAAEIWSFPVHRPAGPQTAINCDWAYPDRRKLKVKVIASSIRKGNIIEREDGQLYV